MQLILDLSFFVNPVDPDQLATNPFDQNPQFSTLLVLFDLILYVPSTIFQLNRDSLPGLNQYLARINEPVHEISNNVTFLTCVDSDESLQPPFKLRNSKWCSVSSLTIIEYASD